MVSAHYDNSLESRLDKHEQLIYLPLTLIDFVVLYLAGVCSIANYIYAVGGYDGVSQLNSVERYDVEKDRWEFVSSMNSRRSALSVDVVGGKLYALGMSCKVQHW